MKIELGNTVAFIMLKLAKHFSKNNIALSQTALSEEEVESYIKALSDRVEEQSQAVKDNWLFIQKKLAEQTNELDKLSTWINAEEVTCCFELKTCLALVYAALTDKDVFWQETKNSLPKTVSQITLRGEFEEQYPKDEADRLLTLWKSFQIIASRTSICHAGIRNEFCMTLNGVYPGVELIEDINAYIHSFLLEHLYEQIETFKSAPERYREILFAEMQGERSEHLKMVLMQSKSYLQSTIERRCNAQGVKPELFKKLLEKYLDALDDLSVSWEKHAALSALSSLLAPSLKTEDGLRLVVKKWIKVNYQLDNNAHEQQVISFNNAQNAVALLQKFQTLIATWNQEVLSQEQIEQLSTMLDDYHKDCLDKRSPQCASDTLLNAMKDFEKACEAFKADRRYDWVENFFAKWSVAKIDAARQLYKELNAPEMQEKYLVTTDFLKLVFPEGATKIDVTPYQINRLFLHAIMVPVAQWKGDFFKSLLISYKYVVEKLATGGKDKITQSALKKDSYGPNLMSQINYLLACYSKDKEPTAPSSFYIPMKHVVKTITHCCDVINHLTGTQEIIFINALGHNCLKNLITDNLSLAKVIKVLTKTKIPAFIDVLGCDFVRNRITSAYDLTYVMKNFQEFKWSTFINTLGEDFLKTVIISTSSLSEIKVLYLSEAQNYDFINALGADFLKQMIRNKSDLIQIMKYQSEAHIPAFIGALDYDFLGKLSINAPDVLSMIKTLSETQQSACINGLIDDFLKMMITAPLDLNYVMKHLFETRQSDFINVLGFDFLKSLIRFSYEFYQVLESLPKTHQSDFISSVRLDDLKQMIENRFYFCRVTQHLSKTNKSDFVSALGYDFLKNLIESKTDFASVMNHLSETQKSTFINHLGYDYLKNLFNDGLDFAYAMSSLTETEIPAFINALDYDFLNDFIDYDSNLNNTTTTLSDAQKSAYIQVVVNLKLANAIDPTKVSQCLSFKAKKSVRFFGDSEASNGTKLETSMELTHLGSQIL